MNATKEKPKSKTESTRKLGTTSAIQYLEQNGYKILESGWKHGTGEVDLIAKGEGDLCFIEIKTRQSSHAGLPEETLTAVKRKQAEKAAISYLATYDGGDCSVRFDIICVNILDGTRAFLRHHKDVFTVAEAR